MLYGPLAPRKTFELLRQVKLVAQVRGNQDRLILDGPRNPTLNWVRSDLGDELLGWLAALPALAKYQDRLLCRGSPSLDTIYLLEDVTAGFARVRSEPEIQNLVGALWPRGFFVRTSSAWSS
jgi:diadenosine tetraphosphatase ApaH/serine/threonine PP2A family protein phosphatase